MLVNEGADVDDFVIPGARGIRRAWEDLYERVIIEFY